MMYPIKKMFFMSFFILFSLSRWAQSSPGDTVSVYIIPVSGDVDPAMAAFIGRAVTQQDSTKKTIYLFEMDTFGGRVDAALQIVDTIANSRNTTIAYVKTKAISAGALIALSCQKLYMRPNTTIGDCAPIAYSNEGPQMLGEKFQSPLRAKFRALAKKNNYPVLLAESMVSADMSVIKIELPDTTFFVDSLGYEELPVSIKKNIVAKTTVVQSGELLTMDNQEAKNLAFSTQTVGSIEEVLQDLGIENYRIERVEETWSEIFVGFIGVIAPILMMVGFAALYIEIKTPGFGIPGIVGILCLGLVFAGQYLVGLANYTELLLLVIGILLLGLELFVIPGFGVAGIAGIVFLAVGMILSLQGFVIPQPQLPWQNDILQRNVTYVSLSLIGSLFLLFIFFKYIFPKISKVVTGPYLSATLQESHILDDFSKNLKPGDKGIVVKTLRPSGMVEIGEKIYDVTTDGEFIEKGSTVVVTEVCGNRIRVNRSHCNDQ